MLLDVILEGLLSVQIVKLEAHDAALVDLLVAFSHMALVLSVEDLVGVNRDKTLGTRVARVGLFAHPLEYHVGSGH